MKSHIHARRVKIRNGSLPWMNSSIRKELNKRYKLLLKAQQTPKDSQGTSVLFLFFIYFIFVFFFLWVILLEFVKQRELLWFYIACFTLHIAVFITSWSPFEPGFTRNKSCEIMRFVFCLKVLTKYSNN